MAKSSTRKSVHLTDKAKQDFERFGCTFEARAGVFCIDLRGKTEDQATSAAIFSRLGRLESQAGPLVFLALEISPTRPLPQYCYFPFDLKNKSHRAFLDQFLQTGKIRLRFYTGERPVERNHELTPYLRSNANEVYKKVLADLEQYGSAGYSFDVALQLLEQWARIPELLERRLPEDVLREISERTKIAVQAMPFENQQFAKRLVSQATEIFGPYIKSNENTLLDYLHLARMGLTYLSELHRLRADNPTLIDEILGDAIAASFSWQELENLNELLKIGVALFKLLFKAESTPTETEPLPRVPDAPAGLGKLVQTMVAQGISKDSLLKFAEIVGLRLGGRSGRPPKDYSNEYDLKVSGNSWAGVARLTLLMDPVLETEFGGSNYDLLTFEKRETLKHRIREGVKSYAKRNGKPLPSQVEADEPDQSEGEQKNL